MTMFAPLVLLVLDGWGMAPPGPGNAISLGQLTSIPNLWNTYAHTQLTASGEAVGLPSGENGNTETGHLNIGAGRVVYQDLLRINMAITDGSFSQNNAFLAAIAHARTHASRLHIMGLLSDSHVHASRDHLYGLLELVKKTEPNIPVLIHVFTDGRDSLPNSAPGFIKDLEDVCKRLNVGQIATIAGRYYGMDRDLRWERTEKAYDALTKGANRFAPDALTAIEQSYKEGKTDEFIEPTVILDSSGEPLPRIGDNDSIIFFNYRIDRPRQLTRAFILLDFETRPPQFSFDPYAVKYFHKHTNTNQDPRAKPFTRQRVLQNLFFVTMTQYERDLPCSVAYPPKAIPNTLGQVLSERNIRQLRLAESEKERFVGYYFNGQAEEPFPGEDRIIIPSPGVSTYDLKPEMSAWELTDRVIDRLSLGIYGFMLVNFANPDMVGHTGNIQAAIKACETVDECVGKIVEKVLAAGGACIVTADHGNVEEMLTRSGEVDSEHSVSPVPFIMISEQFSGYPSMLPSGKLGDVAPTILSYLNIPIPKDMTGFNLFHRSVNPL